jgi:hypothetical protein
VQVSWFSLKIKVDDFSRFHLKTSGYGSYGFASKPLAQVSRFGPQNRQLWFGIGPQNHCDSFLVWASKPSELWFVDCATKLIGG